MDNRVLSGIAIVLAIVALFVGVMAYMAVPPMAAFVQTGVLTTKDIGDNQITTYKLANYTILNEDLATSAVVNSSQIINYTIANYDLATSDVVNGSQILNSTIQTGDILDATLNEADLNRSDVKLLNYSAAGTKTAGKTLVANGTVVTGSETIKEGGLSLIDYVVLTATNNRSCVATVTGVNATHFEVHVWDVTDSGKAAITAVRVNWTAIGTP